MAYPLRLEISLDTPIADGIAQSQTLSGGGIQNVTLNGSLVVNGVAVLDVARRVVIDSIGDDSGITFTINGTNYSGISQSENITGGNNDTVVSVKDFLTVTSIVSSGDTAAAIEVGTNDVASTPWILTDHYDKHKDTVGVHVKVFPGSVLNYSVESTGDDLQDITLISDPTKYVSAIVNDNPAIMNATVDGNGGYGASVVGVRLLLNSYTSGKAQITLV